LQNTHPWRARISAGDLVLFFTVVAVWGSSWLPLRLQLGVVAPEVSGVWRFAIASAIMFAWVGVARERFRFSFADHLRFATLGLTLFSLNFVFAYYSGFYLTGGLIAVVFSVASVINPLLAAALGRGALDGRALGGALVGTAGIALLFGPEIAATEASRDTALGLALAFIATLSFCIGNMFSSAFQQGGMPVVPANAWGMFYGTSLMAGAALVRGEPFIVEWTARYLLSIAYMTLASTVIGFFAYVTLIGRIGPGRAGYATVLVPVVALIISTLFENYVWTLVGALGVFLVLAGNALVLSAPRRG
jgi:drug/metabolite transporter (DMT)-like permease